MNSSSGKFFALNGINYDRNHLSPEAQHLLCLLSEAKNELNRLENQKALVHAAQQQLIRQLKPLLPPPTPSLASVAPDIKGCASKHIPTTPVEKPAEELPEFPQHPEGIPAK